jgi:serine/threonine protein phosphatase PrpC
VEQGWGGEKEGDGVNVATEKENHFLDRDMVEAEARSMAGGQVVVYSSRCPEKTTPNEDAAALIPLGDAAGVLVVADGMGGGQAGEQASRIATECMVTTIEEGDDDETLLRTAILNGFERANEAILERGVGAATTLAVIEISEQVVRPYHVGDSMILVVGQRGKVKLQTTPHSPVGFAVEAGMLDEKDAIHHEDRHVVSNVIGSSEMKIEIGSPVKLALCDTVLVASDGLFDNLHVPEIVETIRKGKLMKAAGKLIEAARRRMAGSAETKPSKPDDLTFILYRRGAK